RSSAKVRGRIRGRESFLLDGCSGDRVVSGHAEALALPYGWVRLPRPQPGRGAGHHLPQGRRLRRLREDPAPGQGLVLGALFGLLPYAQSLAPCPVAAQRWRSLEIPALADGHAHATLPCPLPHGRQRPAVPGALQVFPDRRGRTFADRAALRRAESAAGRPGAPCGRLALVQPVAAAARRGGAARRRTGAAAAVLVGVRESAGDRGRAGGPAALGGAWQSLRRAGLGGADRQAIGIRGNVTAPGTSTQTDTEGAEITTPDPF